MLGFFRKYQRYFFLLVTIVIVISFSFFGTYNAIPGGGARDQIAFVAVDGTEVSRSELDQLVMFIGTDAEDKLLFGGIWGPNFLNDGVIKKDFLHSGLAEQLAGQYSGDIEQDLIARREKEKRYTLYSHPQAQFLNVTSAWNYLAPDVKISYEALKNGNKDVDQSFHDRVQLFLAEKKFPAPLLRQVILYQQQQYSWLTPDPNLERHDFSLFGYHTTEDWFGPRFLRIVGEFIINASIVAEQRGYQVSRSDALADLIQNSETSYKQVISNPNLGVANSSEYFNEQLHRMQLDKNSAATLWKKVMLCRRMFHDAGNSVFVDPLLFQKYNEYAMETVEGDLYRLPPEFRLDNTRDLQKFQIYLNAVSRKQKSEKNLLALPTEFYSVTEITKNNPELVQKRYILEVANYDKNALQIKVGLKQTWNWEVEDQNWEKLQKHFGDLGNKKAPTRDERFAVLDQLDDKTRRKVDEFAREAIVESHPEWLEQSLKDAESQTMTVSLRLKGGKSPFVGLKNNQELMKLLDQAKLGEQDPALTQYTSDGQHFYRILVKDRSPDFEILTFGEAQQEGSLDAMLDKKLETYYSEIREMHPREFQKEDKSWKAFADVKIEVGDLYFSEILKAVHNQYTAANTDKQSPAAFIGDISASLRFYPYFKDFLGKANTDQNGFKSYLKPSTPIETDNLLPRQPLEDQWKLEKTAYQSERGKQGSEIDLLEAFEMKPATWSSIQSPANGDMHLFYLTHQGNDATMKSLSDRISAARDLLSDEAQKNLMESLLHEIKDKKSISLDYLNQGTEMEG
jgi:GcvH upstream region-like protein